jgi:opacity protein-like surface antigen
MRRVLILSAMFAVCIVPATARAQGSNRSLQGFGGVTFGTSSVLGGASMASTFGGTLVAGIAPNIQIIGEVGRMSDIKPPLFDLLDFTPVDLRVSAWYGEGGIRFIASPRSAIRPYGEASAGFARLSTGLSGFSGRTDAIIDTGLSFLNRTEPMLGAGAGIVLQGGPLSVDIGYRYKKIMASGAASVLNGGSDYRVNDVRVGVGISF